jgi:hypothetical protein
MVESLVNKGEMLWHIIQELRIKVKWRNLHSWHPDWDAYAWPARRLIVLDYSVGRIPRREKCVLAEEVGHIFYPPAGNHIVYHSTRFYDLNAWQRNNLSVLVAKDERQALEWGTSFLIPDNAFWKFAARGPHFWEDWLDHFDVEDWFMMSKFKFMWHKKPFEWTELVIDR